MRTVAARSAPAAAATRPALRGPAPRRRAGAARPGAAAGACELVPPAAPQRLQVGLVALPPAQPEVRAHAGAQHLGRPQRRRALERQHLRARPAPRRCAGCCRRCRRPAAGRAPRGGTGSGAGAGSAAARADVGRRLQRAQLGEQRMVGSTSHARARRQRAQRGLRPGRLGQHTPAQCDHAARQRGAQVVALQPQPGRCAAVGAAVARQPAQAHQQRVVARA
jgi:hypothetical protein